MQIHTFKIMYNKTKHPIYKKNFILLYDKKIEI